MSSKKATILFTSTVLAVGGFIYYIHLDQTDARKKMRQGVINDIQRQKYKETLKKVSNSNSINSNDDSNNNNNNNNSNNSNNNSN
ncbi:hypothetical protein DICPUDRAFT_43889 [Dictyostelium purpureum]|uniref:Uncharacterized protein n=1 Tax=Dictyostelium purpureum TaxID=5786 RepID=F1A511_DICPU|nr:uncharacterized protein DICPUDRAFT_43889 [Dictyostelium purpureum]EGC28718.1 hypothetical protein DICPUDRAFT_43889 [Dictyostelium purpureum]|eukprot:XP_003294755.1 hypothetical protein DICPUDRAFT_43889 [Dictyostelium purpureum]